MLKRCCLLALITALSLCGASANGHDDQEFGPEQVQIRTWTHATGRYRIHGSFVAVTGDQVQIRKESGELGEIKLAALSASDREWIEQRRSEIRSINLQPALRFVSFRRPTAVAEPVQIQAFQPFKDKLKLRWDDQFFYVESNGMPDHPMMVGITAWQQQVPIPQKYTGNNAWRVPLHPVPAEKPMSAKDNFFRGAIALAVNGVPIFNPIKNDGRTDTLLAGELDEFGGHCGRADDYHYHIAPVHLEPKTGKGKPLAYALDGYPIYGYDEPDGSKVKPLDRFNGHEGPDKSYHYHATRTYPYLNGGFHGEVTERGGQVDPQPRAESPRPALPPLRGATITAFESPKPDHYTLTYEIRGRKSFVKYALEQNGSVTFQFVDANGRTTTESYSGRPRGGPAGGRPQPGRRGEAPPPERPGRGGPVSPLSALLDTDKDGELSQPEIASAAKMLLLLDRNGDGELTEAELRPQGGPDDQPPAARPAQPQPGDERPNAAAARERGQQPRGPDPNDPNRKPWIQVHASEMDANHDGILTRQEMLSVAETTFNGYDRNKDGKVTLQEANGPGVRTAMGGNIKLHFKEIDRDSDEAIAKEELLNNAARMFDRADRNEDGKLTPEELAAQPGPAARARGRGAAPERGPAERPERGEQQPRGGDQRKGQGQRQGGGQGNQAGGRNNARQTDPNQPPPFRTQVPSHPVDIILGKPTDTGVTLSVISYTDAEAYVAYGKAPNTLDQRSKTFKLSAGKSFEIELKGLEKNAAYSYRLNRRSAGEKDFQPGELSAFQTQRSVGSPFIFTVQADSHLDLATEPDCYVRTLKNALADRPDFHIELGDTFMTDKFARYTDAISQYRAQRYYFGLLCHSAPLFFVLGNHDGESGARFDGTLESMSGWSATMRKQFLPNPFPNDFYSGNIEEKSAIGKLGDYYAWTWGDALFVVLDPFWYTTTRRVEGDDYWSRTLGEAQYRWLEKTLTSSKAKYKFLFIHHLVGGGTREARGGAEASAFFEWGGKNLDGTAAFEKRRPGWTKPIHDLLVANKVSAVFHGHDHFYAHQERDGVVYQLVPQPGNPRYGEPRSATEYGYLNGKFLGGPGYLRISVGPDAAKVEYVLTVLPKDERENRKNGQVVDRYVIGETTKPGRR